MSLDSEFVVVVQGNEAQLECRLLFGFEQGQTISWSWFLDGQLLENSANTVVTYEREISTLKLKKIDTISKNKIECRAENRFGEQSRVFTLKVKSIYFSLCLVINGTFIKHLNHLRSIGLALAYFRHNSRIGSTCFNSFLFQ